MDSNFRILVIFANPPGTSRIRIDKEDRELNFLSKRFSEKVEIEKLHASEIEDIYSIISNESYHCIQFSGHGNEAGIVLDQSDLSSTGELVSAERLRSLLSLADTPPIVAILLSCYSNDSLHVLSEIAPFVITAIGQVDDNVCIQFISAFYEKLLSGFSVQSSFESAILRLKASNLGHENISLNRRILLNRGDSVFVESTPDPKRDSILVNLDSVKHLLGSFDMTEAELLHLISKKLHIHYWIFTVPRERCIIPIGRLLFGEFSWKDSNDVVYCSKLMKLSDSTPQEHWKVWHQLLLAYNDLFSSEYRILPNPASPKNINSLTRSVNLFNHNIEKYLRPNLLMIEKLGFKEALPLSNFVITHNEAAKDNLELHRLPEVVQSLEQALSNLHGVVEILVPPEQN